MRVKQFLMIGGVLLLLLAVLGFAGFSLGNALYFDKAENWAHLVLGVVALAAYYYASPSMQKTLAMGLGVVALYFGIHGLFLSQTTPFNYFGVTNLEYFDDVAHLAIGVWGLWAGMDKKGE